MNIKKEKSRDFVKDWGMPDKATIATARRGVLLFKKTVSPVFMSTRTDGTIVRGLSAIPDKDQSRPLLLIGNHQFLTIDISLVVEALLTEKNILPRGNAMSLSTTMMMRVLDMHTYTCTTVVYIIAVFIA
jgi:hypothetical protein